MFTLRNTKWKPYIPFIALFVLMLVFHLFLWEHPDLDTARFFAKALKKRDLWEFLARRYDKWSSRLVIEGFLVFFANHIFLWKIIDSLLFLLLSGSFAFILTGTLKDVRINWLITGAILMYPFGEMQSAGWAATTMNYFWPLVFGIFSCTVPVYILYKEKSPRWWHVVLAALAGVYACNMEQMCGVLFAVYIALFILILAKKRNFSASTLILICIDISSLVFILNCPGNSVRMVKELETTLTEGFQDMNIIDKLLYALNDTCMKLVDESFVFMVVSVAIFILVCIKTKNLTKRIIALFPPLFVLYRYLISGFLPSISLILLEDPVVYQDDYSEASILGILFLWILLLGTLLAAIMFLADNRTERIMVALLFLMGLASRLVVGLSPSLENSSYRTFIYFDFILLFIMLLGIKKCAMEDSRQRDILRLMYGGAAMIKTVDTFIFSARLTL